MAQAEVMPVTQQKPIGRPGDPCVMVIFGAAGDPVPAPIERSLQKPA